MEWTAPKNNGGADVTEYQVFYNLVDETALFELTQTADTKYVITGLTAGETYEIKV